MSFHTIILVGNLGRDPEVRYTPKGEPVASFSMATERQYNGDEGRVKETLWFRVQVFGNQAISVGDYLVKGSKVLVEGRLQGDAQTGSPKIWTGKDGKPHVSFEVTASTVRFLSSKEPGEQQGELYNNEPKASDNDW